MPAKVAKKAAKKTVKPKLHPRFTLDQKLEMEREIHQLKRAISIRESLQGVTASYFRGKPVPGTSTVEWKQKLVLYETAYAEGRYYNPSAAPDIFDMTGEVTHDIDTDDKHSDSADIFDLA